MEKNGMVHGADEQKEAINETVQMTKAGYHAQPWVKNVDLTTPDKPDWIKNVEFLREYRNDMLSMCRYTVTNNSDKSDK